FYRRFAALPTIAGARVQRVVEAGYWCAAGGAPRGYVVLQYVPGQTLEAVLAAAAGGMLPVGMARSRRMIGSFLYDVLIPTWSAGYRFWDFRAANLVVGPEDAVSLIDLDMLAKMIDEWVAGEGAWAERD